MKRVTIVVLLFASIRCMALTAGEITNMLDSAFCRDMSYDGPLRPRRFTTAGMPLCEAYTNIFEQSGLTALQLENMVLSTISNRCTSADFFSAAGNNRIAYRGAVGAVGRHCGTNALPTLEYAFANSVGANALDEALAIVRLRGTGHDAFSCYRRLFDASNQPGKDRAGDLAIAVSKCVCETNQSAAVTNRAVGFFLEAAWSSIGCEVVADQTLCELWGPYATSSNRYVNIGAGIGRVANNAVSGYLLEAKASLEALPPGTMQMLSTNQFYNVED